MDSEEAADLDAADGLAGGDNSLNPVTMAMTLHPPDSSSQDENSAVGGHDTSGIANVINSSASLDEMGKETFFEEDTFETDPVENYEDDRANEVAEMSNLGIEDLGPRDTEMDYMASDHDFPPGVNGDPPEVKDGRGSEGASDESVTEENRPDEEQGSQGEVGEDGEGWNGESKDEDLTPGGGDAKESSGQEEPIDDPVHLKRRQRNGLYKEGLKLQETMGNTDEALRCYLAAITGLTESEAFTELPQCLHQISNIYFEKKEYEKAVHFIQAEKMYYETALIDIVNLQKQLESTSEESTEGKGEGTEGASSPAGPDSPEIVKAKEYEDLAKLCLKESKPQLALEYCGKATKIYREVYGDAHPVTIGSLDLFTVIYADVGKKLYTDAMQKFDAEEKVLAESAAQSQTESSDQATTSGEETTSEVKQRSKDVSQSAIETETQAQTELEPAPQPEDQDDWVTTCLLMLLFLLVTFLVLLIMAYFTAWVTSVRPSAISSRVT
ncbi:uncharacterized protein LOC110980524 [Acanthaster planci]|uniref:Uncharacterized protein LOC110980524 n=1 Tax=Acanthaster planci TaxID=133434 RepID=A0A8B7YKN4_ACAPL|nr:uncharacterized protein LOC110980524 [Acanthaster planci]XP_022092981.1 uncharacterized protein LOC110980524 [Acanthaster planci]